MAYFVYIIECTNKSLYTGITNDLVRRFNQHRTGQGGHYTSYNPAVKLRYKEEYPTRSAAAKREAQIKGWSRTKKLALIKGDKGFLKAAARCKSR
jgi:putative endonuclease